MRIAPLPGVLQKLQDDLQMTDEKFADYIETSRASLWRAKLPTNDSRFSLGQDVMTKILTKFPNKKFEELFFLIQASQECYKGDSEKGAS